MKKSLLALAVLGAFASTASAQSSVTMYGRVDLSVGKGVGSANKGMFNGSGSRLGMRGSEALGGGLNAIFNIEHRFSADTGSADNVGNLTLPQGGATSGANSLNRFWNGRSIVGVQGGFGTITFGREYVTAFLQSQLVGDPWGWDTVVAGNGGSAVFGNVTSVTGGGIARVRNDSAITYTGNFGPVNFGLQTAERTDSINSFKNRPVNVAFGLGGGWGRFHFGHEITGREVAAKESWTTVGAQFRVGPWTPGVVVGSGKTTANAKHRSAGFTSTFDVGAGQLRLAVGNLTAKSATGVSTKVVKSGLGLGYHHSLSKRTTVYVDFARNGAVTTQKNGYDVGLKHNF
jgi:predicted porin